MNYNKVLHWVLSVIVFAVPILVSTHTPTLDLTVGGILNAIYLYASQKINPTVSAVK